MERLADERVAAALEVAHAGARREPLEDGRREPRQLLGGVGLRLGGLATALEERQDDGGRG